MNIPFLNTNQQIQIARAIEGAEASNNIMATGGDSAVSHLGGSNVIVNNPKSAEITSFLGKITYTGYNGADDFTNEVYWVKSLYVDQTSATSVTDPIKLGDEVADLNRSWYGPATNLNETKDHAHSLKEDTVVQVFAVRGIGTQTNQPLYQYYFMPGGGGLTVPENPYDISYAVEHTDAAGQTYDIAFDLTDLPVHDPVYDGVKFSITVGASYRDPGDQKLYEFRRDLIYNLNGQLCSSSAAYRIEILDTCAADGTSDPLAVAVANATFLTMGA